MISRKYAKDYTVSYEKTPRGQLKPTPVYVGPRFRLPLEGEALGRIKLRFLLLTVLCGLCLLALLWFSWLFDGDHHYLVLPMALAVLPMALTALGAWRLWTWPAELTREQRDRLANQLPAACFFLALLGVLSLAAGVIQLFVGGLNWANGLYGLCALVFAVGSVLLFAGRKSLKPRPL